MKISYNHRDKALILGIIAGFNGLMYCMRPTLMKKVIRGLDSEDQGAAKQLLAWK